MVAATKATSEPETITIMAEGTINKCLELFATIAAKIAKSHSGLPEINQYIAVIVLKKLEIGMEEGPIPGQNPVKETVTTTSTMPSLKLLTPNWTKF